MEIVQRLLQSRFLRFALVGSGGFVVSEIVLWLALHVAGLGKYSGWLVCFLVAVTFTWWGNRTLTFRAEAARRGLLREWAVFVVANSLGAAANFGTYFVLVTFLPWPLGDPQIAIAAGTIVGLVFNFTASKRFVFRGRSP
jgi:putative flippase GtrA